MISLVLLALAPFLSSAQEQFDTLEFYRGLFEGLQEDVSEPSSCVQMFSEMENTWKELIYTIETSAEPFWDGILIFREYSNDIVETIEKCSFRKLYAQVAEALTPKGFEQVFVRLATSLGTVKNAMSEFNEGITSNDAYKVGKNLATVVSIALNYNL